MLTLSSTKNFSAVMEITDASGHALSSETLQLTPGISQFPVQTTDIPAGVYFIVLHSATGRLVERLLILD
jgi:hypothetical protein